MRVIFTGDPSELERGEGLSRLSTSIFGVTFPMGAEVDVSHLPEAQKRKLLSNPHFRPAGLDAPPAPLVIATAMPEPAAAEAASKPAPAARVGGKKG